MTTHKHYADTVAAIVAKLIRAQARQDVEAAADFATDLVEAVEVSAIAAGGEWDVEGLPQVAKDIAPLLAYRDELAAELVWIIEQRARFTGGGYAEMLVGACSDRMTADAEANRATLSKAEFAALLGGGPGRANMGRAAIALNQIESATAGEVKAWDAFNGAIAWSFEQAAANAAAELAEDHNRAALRAICGGDDPADVVEAAEAYGLRD